MARRKSDAAPAAGPSKANLAYARFLNSNKTYTASFVVFLVVMAGVLYLAIPFGDNGKGGTAKAAPTTAAPALPSAPAPTTNSDGVVGDCQPQASAEVMPETVSMTEYQTEWKPIGQMSIPGSATGGPVIQDPPHCFSRTPEGALYAIATFIAERAETTSNEGIVDVMSRRCLHDAHYEAYASRLLGDTPVTGQPVFGISGYRWMEYSPDRAQIELRFKVITGPKAGSSTTNVFSVLWSANDWLILAPDPAEPTKLPGDNLRTFHTWGDTG